ncbi:dTDP-4-dehydrorhamnose 3,5-epimerase [Lonsdalea quercina]|uniref:dTDP-4-dehydrorhamnose 3,5-epimerase n=1 Tax=Lonsdalea quercina TaxID=71657 RepID=UPI0039756F94
MKIIDTAIPDVKIIEPMVFEDDRGFFMESFNQMKFEEAIGRNVNFVQDNHSKSSKGVLRGLHYQLPPFAQAKLVRCVLGEVLDIAVDVRKTSPTFGHSVSVNLSHSNKRQFWIPEGFAHGFVVLSENAEFVYKTNNYYSPSHERCILWNDIDLNIQWDMVTQPIVSSKDAKGVSFTKADYFP